MPSKVLNWTHWIARNTKVAKRPAAIIHWFLLYLVISCDDCYDHVDSDDDSKTHNRESHMAECDWCVGEWWNHKVFFPIPALQPTQGRSHWLPLSPSPTSSCVKVWKYESSNVWKLESVKGFLPHCTSDPRKVTLITVIPILNLRTKTEAFIIPLCAARDPPWTHPSHLGGSWPAAFGRETKKYFLNKCQLW